MNNSTESLPSLRNRAVLMNLTFNKPQLTKLDSKVTREAEAKHNAPGALRTQRQLYPKQLLAPILAVESEARAYLRNHGVEWGTAGMYLVDTTQYMKVRMELTKYETARGHEVVKFAQNWATVMMRAQQQQGDLYEQGIYPDVGEVVSQFKMKLFVAPLGEFIPELFKDVEEEMREQITEDVEAATRDALLSAVAQPLKKLFSAVLNIHDKTSREKTRMHDSLIGDLEEAVALMPALNILDLPVLNALATRCDKALHRDVNSLKGKDSSARVEVAGNAADILQSVGVSEEDLSSSTDAAGRTALADKAVNTIMDQMEGMF